MRRRLIGVGWLLLLVLAAGDGRAVGQDSGADSGLTRLPAASPAPQAVEPQVAEPVLKPNPLEALRRFEPAEDEEYRLGKGDEITVDFPGRTEMQARLVVGPDGRISLPLAGDLPVAGETRAEAARRIEAALATYYNSLSAQVTVTKYTANRVLLLGAVDHPGLLSFDGPPTLLEALTRGGLGAGSLETGVRGGAGQAGSSSGVSRSGQIPERCAIYRGHEQVLWVELKQLIDSGNSLADLRLRRGDVIYVPGTAERYVSVLGEVQRPGAVPLTSATTLAAVLAAAGGISSKAGNNPRIQIVDPGAGSTRYLSFKDLLNPAKSLEITLRPGEIIYVPQSGFYRASYVLERLSPLVTLASFGLYAVLQ